MFNYCKCVFLFGENFAKMLAGAFTLGNCHCENYPMQHFQVYSRNLSDMIHSLVINVQWWPTVRALGFGRGQRPTLLLFLLLFCLQENWYLVNAFQLKFEPTNSNYLFNQFIQKHIHDKNNTLKRKSWLAHHKVKCGWRGGRWGVLSELTKNL